MRQGTRGTFIPLPRLNPIEMGLGDRILLSVIILGLVVSCAGTVPTAQPNTAPAPSVPTIVSTTLPAAATPTAVPTNLPSPPTPALPPTAAPTSTEPAIPTEPAAPIAASTSLPSPEAEYPLSMNNTWVYESTRYEGFNAQQIMTATETITETVVEVKNDPSYFAAKIDRETGADIAVSVPQGMESMLRPADSAEYWLVFKDNRLYRQEGSPDLSNLAGGDTLEFLLPLKTSAKWILEPARLPTDPDQSSGISREALKTGTVRVPAGTFDGCFFIKDNWADTTVGNWFCPGVGWVDLVSDHNGTPEGSHQVLISFHLATSASGGVVPSEDVTVRAALQSFMEARINRDEKVVLDRLTDQLRSQVMQGLPSSVPLFQASNPCWYRYQIIDLSQPSPTKADARVRVYEHQWPGDNAGSLPASWEQEIILVDTATGWRVDQLSSSSNGHEEPGEPHGPTLSACIAYELTPTIAAP